VQMLCIKAVSERHPKRRPESRPWN